MDEFFDLYRQNGNGLGLREWITTRYPALYAASPHKMPQEAQDVNKSIPSLKP